MKTKISIAKRVIIHAISFLSISTACYAEETVLENYVRTPDENFEYSLVKTRYDLFYTTYILDLTSQQWHPDMVLPKKWKHWLVIVEPRLIGEYTEYLPFFSLVRTDTALLYLLRGDADHEDRPSDASPQAVQLAVSTRSIVAELHGIPIGPVTFLDEQPEDYGTFWCDDDNPFKKDDEDCELLREEDSLQARAFDLALSTGDFTWSLMAPMTKTVISSMDVMQDFLQQRYLGRRVINDFVLTGHSKRGHVAWLSAALDSRVTGVIPVSYDLLNLSEQVFLQEASWPERSPEQDANEEFDLYNRFKSDIGTQLIADIDPYAYSYRDRLTMPALILVGTGDNYSCSDAANLYLGDMPGDTRISYMPNYGHDIREIPEVQNSIATFYRGLIKNQPMPDFTWEGLTDGVFKVKPGAHKPVEVNLWTATNPSARDFREITDILWTSTVLEAGADGSYTGSVTRPQQGYTAFYIELTYQDNENYPLFTLATPITILVP
jgi:PhoPQ-activated pathogenicity-related protein